MYDEDMILEMFDNACNVAIAQSREHDCVKHVCAVLGWEDGVPCIIRFKCSDWKDGTTMKSYQSGQEM